MAFRFAVLRPWAVAGFSIPALLAAAPAAGAGAPDSRPTQATAAVPPTPPVWFEPNRGQAPADVRMLARAAGCLALLTDDGAVVRRPGGSFRLRFAGAAGRVEPREPLPGVSHYLVGRDASAWLRGVPHHGGALLDEALPGVDVRWTAEGRDLRFDVELERAADADLVAVVLEGADAAAVDPSGALVVAVGATRTAISAPVAWQDAAGGRTPVAASWAPREDGSFGFVLGDHDPSAPLVIDPTIHASTYLGANKAEAGLGVATDVNGQIFLCGSTASSQFPARPTTGSSRVYQPVYGEPAGSPNFDVWTDGFVAKLSPDARTLLWATFLGGGGNDAANDVEFDRNGDLLVCGTTAAPDFPTTSSPYATSGSGFVSRLTADGTSLLVSTYLARAARRVAADSQGSVVVLSDASPAQVQKFNSGISTLSWADTYTPASGNLIGLGIAIDGSDNVWVAGYTSNNAAVPTTGTRYDSSFNGGTNDALLWRCTASTGGRTLETYLGGSGDDRAEDVAVDATGALYVCGTTASTNFPTASALQGTNRGGTDGFVTKVASSGASLVWSTYFGGGGTDTPHAVALNSAADVFVAGETTSTSNFQVVNAIQSTHGGGTNDGFVAKLSSGGTLRWSTYFGGNGSDTCADVTVGPTGRPMCTGQTASATTFPVSTTAFQTTNAGSGDAYAYAVEESTNPFGVVTPETLTEATEQIYYNIAGGVLRLTGGRTPLTWSLLSGAIPPGMSLSAGGVLSGPPNAGSQGDYTFTARVIDADGAVVTRQYSIRVYGPPVFTGTTLPDWTVHRPMSAALPVTGGRPPLAFRLTAGTGFETNALPPGTLLDFTRGLLLADTTVNGATQSGDFSFTVTVTDTNGASTDGTLSIHFNEPPVVEDTDFSQWTEGRPYARTFTGSKGTPPYSWSLASGTLPVTGTVAAATGRISGNVQPAGDYTFTVQVQDAAGSTATRQFSMHSNPTPSITTESLALALVERAFAGKLESAGGTGERRYFLTGEGSFPVGFQLDGFTGELRGTPFLAKEYSFEVRVTDDAGASGRRFVPLRVVPFFSLAAKKNVQLDTFTAGAGEVRRFIELLAGSRLEGTFRLVGKGTLGATLRMVDAETGEDVDLTAYAKTKGTKTTLRNFVVEESRRFFLIVEPAPDFAGTVETSLRATPRLTWSGRAAVDPAGAPTPVVAHALGGSYLTVTAKKSKKSAALPTIASVTDEAGNELLDLFELKVTKTGVTLRMTKPLALGAVTIHLAGRPEGGAGDVDWSATLKSPKAYDAQFYDWPAGGEQP